MNVAAELFVRTTWMQSSHVKWLRCRQRMRCAQRNLCLRFLLRRFRSGQQFALGEICLADDELPAKHSTFFDRDRFRGHVPIENAALVNGNGTGGNDFAGHTSLDIDVSDSHPPKTLNIGFPFDGYLLRADASRDFRD